MATNEDFVFCLSMFGHGLVAAHFETWRGPFGKIGTVTWSCTLSTGAEEGKGGGGGEERKV